MATLRRRIRHFDHLGHARLLTFSCYRRLPLFNRDRTRHWFVETLAAARQKHGFALWAWVVMPEHVHVLLWPRPPCLEIAPILSSLKLPVARKALRFLHRGAPQLLPRLRHESPSGRVTHRFWQRGPGHDLNLWEPAKIWAKFDYLHHYPVVRGLCVRPEDWYWSSAADYLRLRSPLIELDWDTLPADPRPEV